jgi:nicotinate dehydrogenase subunit B
MPLWCSQQNYTSSAARFGLNVMNEPKLPPSLAANPLLSRWIAFLPDKTARIASGKVEIGQGIVTALRQIAAEELDLDLQKVTLASGDTEIGPDENYTTSSLSIMASGAAIRAIASEARSLLMERAALRLNCSPEDLKVSNGAFLQNGEATDIDYWDVASEIDWQRNATASKAPKASNTYKIVGKNIPRDDLPKKVNGGGFIHDRSETGMLHARMLRQPSPSAQLLFLDQEAIKRAAAGEIQIIQKRNFIAFVAEEEWLVEKAARAASNHVTWTGTSNIPRGAADARKLPGKAAVEHFYGDPEPISPTIGKSLRVSVTRPYVAHASIGPSVALARWKDSKLDIWSHGQGMHPLRRNLALALNIDEASIHARHSDGPGCYGHNGADDAALDAAIIALEIPNTWIRMQWQREEEFAFEPVGPAMQVDIEAVLDANGNPIDWKTDIWSPVHVQRPGAAGVVMLGAQSLGAVAPGGDPADPPPERGYGGPRNAFPAYKVGQTHIHHHLIREPAVRTSALRGLGALPNVCAIERMMDLAALEAGKDPVEYRLSLLNDDRARSVLQRTSELCDWSKRGTSGTGKGLGIAYSRYKNIAAMAGVAVAVTVEEEIRLEQIWAVADAGLAINPDGILNQLEGGCVQGASWALKEEVKIEGAGIISTDWDSYPILRFSEIPEINVELISRPDDVSLGVGECTVGPTAAAIMNAVAHALGEPILDMPLTRERVMASILKN